MKRFRNLFLLLLLLSVTEIGIAQQVKFRNVLGNTGYDYGMSAQQVKDKGYIVCGSTTSVGNGNTDMFIIKTDSMGKPVNEKSIGGINVDRGICIKETADSGYVVLGYTNGLGAGGYDIYVLKMDTKLNVQWGKTYGGTDWDFGNCIEQTSDGGYIICGGTYSYGKGDEDYYLIKTDSNGDTLWTNTYGGKERDEARSVIQTKDGGYAITGFSASFGDSLGNFYTLKTNSTGDTLWSATFGGQQFDQANDIAELQAGGYVVGGETKSVGAGKSDGILVEISSSGKPGKKYLTGDKEDDNIQSVTERKDGKIVFTGITFSYGFTNGKGDIYFGILNSDWSYNMSTTFGSLGRETVSSVANTADKGAIICGSTNGFRNFLDDIYLIKTDSTGFSTLTETVLVTRIAEQKKNDALDFTIFPNPVQHTVYLDVTTLSSSLSIYIYDVMGRVVKQETIRPTPKNLISLNVDELADDVYFIKIITDDAVFSKRMIVKH